MNWRDLLFVVMFLLTCATYHNALEAHRHAHELACHVGAMDLCGFHEHPHE